MGLEGIVSKRRTSAYRSGRSPHWLKANGGAPRGARELGAEKTAMSKPGVETSSLMK